MRTSFEALDWLDPAGPIERWSDRAVEGIGWLGQLGLFQGDPDAPRRAFEAVPANYQDNVALLSCRWQHELWVRGDRQAAAALVDAHRPAGPFDHVWTEFLRVLGAVNLVWAGELDAELVAAAQRRAAAYVDAARRRGDELTLANGLVAYADSLAHGGSPGEAVAAATEATSIAEALGARLAVATGSRSMADALAAMALSGTGGRVTAARAIRRGITESLDNHATTAAFWALDSLSALLWEYDFPTAYLLRLANKQRWATGTPLPAHALDPATIAELQKRANAMDADETVAFALDAIDRYLAAVEAGEAEA
jgi:hypothetical protein